MTAEEKYREANRRAEANREAFLANVIAFKQRAAPARLKADAFGKAQAIAIESKDRTVDTVRAHPIAISAGVAALAAWFFRKPLLRLAGRVSLPVPFKSRPVPTARFAFLDLTRLGLTKKEISKLGLTRLKITARLLRHYLPKALRRMKNDR